MMTLGTQGASISSEFKDEGWVKERENETSNEREVYEERRKVFIKTVMGNVKQGTLTFELSL